MDGEGFDVDINKKVELIDQLKRTFIRFEEEEEQLKEQNPSRHAYAASKGNWKQAYASGGGLSSKFSSNMSAGIEKTKVKIRQQIQKKVQGLIDILDRLQEINAAAQESGRFADLCFLSVQTIMVCSNCINGDQKDAIHELIDEQLKTKVLARLLREYRRTIEH